MSLVSDQVRRLDAYLDRLPVTSAVTSEDGHADISLEAADSLTSPSLDRLLRIVQALSATAASNPVLPLHRVKSLLIQSGLPYPPKENPGRLAQPHQADAKSAYEDEIEWLLVTKATVHVYGAILNSLLDQINPLNDDIWYWSDVLNSYTYSSIYTVQTSPVRFWAWTQEIYTASRIRFNALPAKDSSAELVDSTASGLSYQWRQFYRIVRNTIRERSFANIQRKVLSPVALCRSEARRKQAQLRKLKEITASGLGVLMDEGLHFDHDDYDDGDKAGMKDNHDLQGVVERSVALMDVVLKEVCKVDVNIHDFEDKVFAGVEEDPELSVHLEANAIPDRSAVLSLRLLRIIDETLPEHVKAMQDLAKENGRPYVLVRYWLPVVVAVCSSTTVLRILANRQDQILSWVTNLGATIRDFWFNWIVQPVDKVIKTIRHDESSEIAIMSRDSLKADRESLERMVVDFARDKPRFAHEGNEAISEARLTEIRSKVAEGDVTPVLRAYEQDLRSPLKGAVRGDLVRSLLIQVQKTKVDLEVAMTGIDSLLKSQELVFGFVGLTPGILVFIGVLRYLRGGLGGRSSLDRERKSGLAVRILRNIDRILSEARPTENNVLSYRDHGLLLCEVHALRCHVSNLMPGEIEKEFLEDLDDLANIKGIQVQAKALERIRWAYGRWLK